MVAGVASDEPEDGQTEEANCRWAGKWRVLLQEKLTGRGSL